MGLDYTEGCVNFRDVGEYINLILGEEKLSEKLIYRGGSIDHIKDESEIGYPKSIFNLRNRADFGRVNAEHFHFPMSNKIEKYDTKLKEVKNWLNQIIKELENPDLKYPVFVHCLSGKDRTGIVIAAILLVLKIDKNAIIEEYLLSDGGVNEGLIQRSLEGMENLDQYFNEVDIEKVRKNLLEKNK